MKLFSWGANTYSQLGQGLRSEQCVLPTEIPIQNIPMELRSVKHITGGGGHTLILDEYGEIYSCGWNTKGQLGHPIDTDIFTFKKLQLPKDYRGASISCGWDSSMAITKNGVVLAWGSNSYGQLGLPKKEIAFSATPIEVPIRTNVSKISMGLRHTAMVTLDGRVLTCGDGRRGQLGLRGKCSLSPVNQTDEATEVPGLTDVTSVACGQFHTVALTRNGQCFVWGDNKHGQLGVDPVLHPVVYSPLEITSLPDGFISWKSLHAGWTHTCLLADNCAIVNWGRNTYGQLGFHDYQRPITWRPQVLDGLGAKQISSGSEHCIALTDNGDIYSWGWNEHGNCGVGTEEDVRVPCMVNIDSKYSGILIGTGAGHSFAIVQ